MTSGHNYSNAAYVGICYKFVMEIVFLSTLGEVGGTRFHVVLKGSDDSYL